MKPVKNHELGMLVSGLVVATAFGLRALIPAAYVLEWYFVAILSMLSFLYFEYLFVFGRWDRIDKEAP